jgi:hypothetical protein
VLVAALSSAACGSDVSSAPTPTSLAEVSALVTPTCTARNIGAFYGLAVAGPDAAEVTALPSDFTPTSLITCEPDWAGGTRNASVAALRGSR